MIDIDFSALDALGTSETSTIEIIDNINETTAKLSALIDLMMISDPDSTPECIRVGAEMASDQLISLKTLIKKLEAEVK